MEKGGERRKINIKQKDENDDKKVMEIDQNQNYTVTLHISLESLLFAGMFVTIWIAMVVANLHTSVNARIA